MEKNNKFLILKCPKCGAEYLASEIFYPKLLLGDLKEVVKDDSGKILIVNQEDPNIEEDWECEYCGCNFKAKLNITSSVEYDKESDFSEDFSLDLTNEGKEVLF